MINSGGTARFDGHDCLRGASGIQGLCMAALLCLLKVVATTF
jgi:hypothetical protein